MSTTPWEPPTPIYAAPDAAEPAAAGRWPAAVLAAALPALLLLGLCIAGLSDPPDAPTTGTGSVSRLHVPRQDPVRLPYAPLHRSGMR